LVPGRAAASENLCLVLWFGDGAEAAAGATSSGHKAVTF